MELIKLYDLRVKIDEELIAKISYKQIDEIGKIAHNCLIENIDKNDEEFDVGLYPKIKKIVYDLVRSIRSIKVKMDKEPHRDYTLHE